MIGLEDRVAFYIYIYIYIYSIFLWIRIIKANNVQLLLGLTVDKMFHKAIYD